MSVTCRGFDAVPDLDEPPINFVSVAPAVLVAALPNYVLFGFGCRCRFDPDDCPVVKTARSGGLSDLLHFAKHDIALVHLGLIQPFVATHGLE